MKTEEELFSAVADLHPAERPSFLDAECTGQPELRARLEALLRSHEATGFMDDPNGEIPGPPDGQCGEQFGRYRLLQQIGEGGFGTIWLAEQLGPVTRRVAIKIIKAGMDSREVIARFEGERRALAMMDHPNIASVFDAGTTDKGRPFFVMELVNGTPITKFCDEHQLSTRHRLELFADVCSAISHAHQKGVIHRDIKPSNVMVTLNGSRPVVKIIDFGIAKAIEGRLTDHTLFTRCGQFLGTPAYMSPEQASLTEVDLDTRSDIYALGVLLYELLTGHPPFDTKSLLSAGDGEMRRIIREVEPARPSARLLGVTPEERTKLARARQSSPEKLRHLVAADLDWIVMKAIEKDRTRRYQTANGLALDIQRFLTNEPVSAGPPTAAYRFRKFARRHKSALAAATGMVAVLIAATGVSARQAVRARAAEKKVNGLLTEKEQALQEAREMTEFLGGLLQSPDPWRDGRTITVAEKLDQAARMLESGLANQPGHRALLQGILGRSYFALGLYPEAIVHQRSVLAYCTNTFGPENVATLKAMNNLAVSLHDSGHHRPEALKMRQQLLPLSSRVNGPADPATLSAMTNLASSLEDAGSLKQALQLEETVLPLRRAVSRPDDPETLRAMSTLANTWFNMARHPEALKLRQEVFDLSMAKLDRKNPDTLRAMQSLAMSLAVTGRSSEALRMRREVLELRQEVLGETHPETIGAMHHLASSLFDDDQREEALRLREMVRQLYERRLKWQHPETLGAMHNLAISYAADGKLDEAIRLQEKVVELRESIESPHHPDLLAAKHSLANYYFEKGRREEALKLRIEVVEAAKNHEALGPANPDTLAAMQSLVTSFLEANRPEAALAVRRDIQAGLMAAFPAVRFTLVPPASDWKWLHPVDGKDPAETTPSFHTSFFLPGFDDSAWKTGTDDASPGGGFGYGRGLDASRGVEIGTPEPDQRHTAYFRHRFSTAQRRENLELRCQRDDGLIVYLDGREVARHNMADGPDAWLLRAKQAMPPDNDGMVHRLPIPGPLNPGMHILAISVHNVDPRSSDLHLGGVSLVEIETP